MKLMESRAVRIVLAWFVATLGLILLAWLAKVGGVPPELVADLKVQLAQFQADAWKLVLALIAKWAAEDFAKWVPVTPPAAPPTVVQTGNNPKATNVTNTTNNPAPPAAPEKV